MEHGGQTLERLRRAGSEMNRAEDHSEDGSDDDACGDGKSRLAGETLDVAAYLAAADVVAVPSRNEGMGRVIVEAMALGLPVVATAVGGIPDVVTDGECGRLIAPEDVDALSAALIELGRDPALRRKLGEAAMQRVEAFSTSVAREKLLAVYASLARAKGLA